jgi:WD40 repeat protein
VSRPRPDVSSNAVQPAKKVTVRLVHEFSGAASSLAFSPNGSQLLATGLNRFGCGHENCYNEVELWDVTSHNGTARLSPVADEDWGWMEAGAVSSNGLVAAGGEAGLVWIWDAASGKQLRSIEHNDDITAVAFGDPDVVATTSFDGTVQVSEPRSGRRITTIAIGTPVFALAFMSNSRLATGGKDGIVRVFDSRVGTKLAELEPTNSSIVSLAAVAGGDRLLIGAGELENDRRRDSHHARGHPPTAHSPFDAPWISLLDARQAVGAVGCDRRD